MSVLNQSEAQFEVLVVNDGSSDSGPEIVRAISDSRLRLISQVNQGVAAARNRGIAEARADFVAFLDADDEWFPEHLNNLMGLRIRDPQASFLFVAYWVDRGSGWKRRIRLSKRHLLAGSSLLQDYFSIPGGKLIPSGTAMRKEALIAVQGYREMFGEDVDLWYRLGALYPVAYSREATAIWHLDAHNRRCVVESKSAALYKPGSLEPSFHLIQMLVSDPLTRMKALEYFRNRERRAILAALFDGDRQYAKILYGWWTARFQKSDPSLEALLGVSASLLRAISKSLGLFSKAQTGFAYVWERQDCKVFSLLSKIGK